MQNNFTNRLGHDGFIWWLGVVEDRQDPLNLGRCRVRIFGWHTDSKIKIPTDSLPWAQPMVPVNQSLTNGTAQEGDYVFGFFFDGLSGQAPCVVGVFPGIPQEFVNNEKGFTDSRTETVLSESPKKPLIQGSSWEEGEPQLNPTIIGEPTTSRLYRNEKIEETLIGYRKSTLDEDVPTSNGSTWSEPSTDYLSKAPYNRVFESESGHLMEFDDTPGHERVNLSHRKGSFVEFYPDGKRVTKIVASDYEIILEDKNVHIKGVCNVTIDGDANLYVKGNVNEKIDGNRESLIVGNVKETVEGNYELLVTGDVKIDGATINLNNGTMGAARIGDTADTGDEGTGGHFDLNTAGTNIIETGSSTVFIGD